MDMNGSSLVDLQHYTYTNHTITTPTTITIS
jgi:hypothetical protein